MGDNIKTYLRDMGGGRRMDSSGSEYATAAVSFKHGNERSGFIKCGNHLDKITCFEILKKDSAPLSWTVCQVTFWLNNESYGGLNLNAHEGTRKERR
jgi:hypothetical protein